MMTKAPWHFERWRRFTVSIGHLPVLPCPTHSQLTLDWVLLLASHATGAAGRHQFSTVLNPQAASLSETKWHELPPVPKQERRWTAWELNDPKMISERRGSKVREEQGIGGCAGKQITALQWVTKCCPSLPNSLLHKLFRVRQVRQRIPLSETEHEGRPFDTPLVERVTTRMRRVSVKAVLEEGTVLCLPKRVFQDGAVQLRSLISNKTEHQPTAFEFAWLQSLVLYKDAGCRNTCHQQTTWASCAGWQSNKEESRFIDGKCTFFRLQ